LEYIFHVLWCSGVPEGYILEGDRFFHLKFLRALIVVTNLWDSVDYVENLVTDDLCLDHCLHVWSKTE
jgi:hypothetical protein